MPFSKQVGAHRLDCCEVGGPYIIRSPPSAAAAFSGRAGVSEEIRFQTKPAIALQQIRATIQREIPTEVVLADAAYGTDTNRVYFFSSPTGFFKPNFPSSEWKYRSYDLCHQSAAAKGIDFSSSTNVQGFTMISSSGCLS